MPLQHTLFAPLRHVPAAVLAAGLSLGLAACSDDDAEGGLLDTGPGAGVEAPLTDAEITVDGPTCIEAGRTSTPFAVAVTDPDGDPVADQFILIEGDFGGEPAGEILATGADGRERPFGANTDDDGEMTFRFVAPDADSIRRRITIALNVQLVVDDVALAETDTAISVVPPAAPSVRIQGPVVDAASGRRAASNSLTVESGERAGEFLVTVTAEDGCTGSERSVANVAVSADTQLNNAVVFFEDDLTALDGTAVFDYFAPTVTARSRDFITITASNAGGEGSADYALFVDPPPPPPALRVTLRGPTSVPAGREQTGYTATVEQVEIDSDGNETVSAAEGVQLNITASDNGTITTDPNSEGLLGVSNEFGAVTFSYTSVASGTAAQTVTLTAAVNTTSDPEAQQGCTSSAADCTDTLQVRVLADTFRFTAPEFGSSALVGEDNAVPLQFEWRDSAGTGVAGCVDLSVSFEGATNSSFGLIVNGDPVPPQQIRRTQLNAAGQFSRDIAVYSDRSGFVTVSATDNRNCSDNPASSQLRASTGVQFQDEVCDPSTDGENCVDLQAPLRVLASPDEGGNQRTADLDFFVRNNAFEPIDGRQVTFSIITAAVPGDNNERVFPGGGTTDANGTARSQYFVPEIVNDTADDITENVVIEACVRRLSSSGGDNGQVCSRRTIRVVAPGVDP